MNALLIDTVSVPAKVGVSSSGRGLVAETIPRRSRMSESLLARIDKALSRAGLEVAEVSCIGVVTGPGSFTSLRLGLATANALAAARAVPLVAVPAERAASLETMGRLVAERYQAGDTVLSVLPHYGKEPTITPPKKKSG